MIFIKGIPVEYKTHTKVAVNNWEYLRVRSNGYGNIALFISICKYLDLERQDLSALMHGPNMDCRIWGVKIIIIVVKLILEPTFRYHCLFTSSTA